MKLYFKYFTLFILFAFISCGSTPAQTITTDSNTIVIIDLTFLPDTTTADPGQTIFFSNQDDVPHQILSQSAVDQFDDTGEFDSLIINSGEIREITIPTTATSGSTLFFYDDFFEDTMVTPNGTITVN